MLAVLSVLRYFSVLQRKLFFQLRFWVSVWLMCVLLLLLLRGWWRTLSHSQS